MRKLLLAATLSVIFGIPAAAEDGYRFSDFCSLRDGAPITKTCFGFMSAVIQLVQDGQVGSRPPIRICSKQKLTVAAALKKYGH